jgi:hypothetical protein
MLSNPTAARWRWAAVPLGVSSLILVGALRAHVGPPIWIELLVEEDAVSFTLSGEVAALTECLGHELALVEPLDRATRADTEEAFRSFLEAQAPLRVDGEPRPLELVALQLAEGDEVDEDAGVWPLVHARCRVSVDLPPRNVGVVWRAYEGTEFESEALVPLEVMWGRRVQGLFVLSPEEPEYVWHRPGDGEPRARPIAPAVVEVAPRTTRLPLLSLGVAAVTVLGFAGLARKKAPAALRAAVVFVGLLGAASLRGVGTVELESSGGRAVAIPDREQALRLFESLHRAVYDAFDARTEDEIYVTLATCVAAGLLDTLYAEVYESLILREEGGAICRVEDVEVLDRDVSFAPDGALELTFLWNWRVRGVVAHWGHTHRRTVEYRARYLVRHDGRAWKITDSTMLEQRRIPD